MKKFSKALDTRDLAALPQVRYEGDPNLVINSASTPQEATKSSVIFLENEKLFEAVEQSEAGLIITTPEFALKLEGRNLLITEKPYFAMMVILEKWLALEKPKEPGIHASAVIASDAVVCETARVENGVTIGNGSVIGEGCIIEAGNETVGKPARPDFLLQPGELLRACEGLHVVAYEDGFQPDPGRFVQRIAAVR